MILNQRAERDKLMARPCQQRDTRYNFDELLANPLIKLITVPRRGYIPGETMYYYRTRIDDEIDVDTRKGSEVEQLIQVCYDMSTEKTRKHELDALVEAAEELHYDNHLVITNSQEEKIEYKGKELTILKVSDF